ncbi:MAG: hypothetical protein HN750_03450 [Gemmatimonadales bacterium]|jgi:hypothetical protein|nr:hypothetical protein [Gemmatimonadales bacterium]
MTRRGKKKSSDEPVLKRSGISLLFVAAVGAYLAFILVSQPDLGPKGTSIVLGILAVLLGLGVATTRTLLTSRRVVRYRPALASLARLLPLFAGLERWSRTETELSDVESARSDGPCVILTLTEGRSPVRLYDFEEARDATEFSTAVQRILGKRRGTTGVAVSAAEREASTPAGATLNCPYCRGRLGPTEVHDCASCNTGHHEECLAIHGGCAVYGCANSPRRRTRA